MNKGTTSVLDGDAIKCRHFAFFSPTLPSLLKKNFMSCGRAQQKYGGAE